MIWYITTHTHTHTCPRPFENIQNPPSSSVPWRSDFIKPYPFLPCPVPMPIDHPIANQTKSTQNDITLTSRSLLACDGRDDQWVVSFGSVVMAVAAVVARVAWSASPFYRSSSMNCLTMRLKRVSFVLTTVGVRCLRWRSQAIWPQAW